MTSRRRRSACWNRSSASTPTRRPARSGSARRSRSTGAAHQLQRRRTSRSPEKAAIESMVLLKNASNTLPIPSSVTKLAVVGATVTYETDNGGRDQDGRHGQLRHRHPDRRPRIEPRLLRSRQGHRPVRRPLPRRRRHGQRNDMHEFAGRRPSRPPPTPTAAISAVMTAATDADFIVVIAGLTAQDEGEEYTNAGDRANLGARRQTEGASTRTSRTTLIQQRRRARQADGGRAGRRQRHRPALARRGARGRDGVVPGPAGRRGAGEAALGAGELQRQAAVHVGQVASTSTTPGMATERRSFGYYVGYSWFDYKGRTPLFPFGYGLAYTKFEYRKLQLGCSDMTKGAVLPVVVNVANTGAVAGDEIVMVWVAFGANTQRPATSRPAKELKGFARVHLAAGRGEADHDSGPPVGPRLLPGRTPRGRRPASGSSRPGTIQIMVGGGSTNSSPTVRRSTVTGY